MIGKINNTPAFTSNVYVVNYTLADNEQRRIMNSPEFLAELDNLSSNDRKDTVVFTPDAYSEDIYMTVTQKVGKDMKTSGETIIDDASDIQPEYNSIKEGFKSRTRIEMTDPIINYVV